MVSLILLFILVLWCQCKYISCLSIITNYRFLFTSAVFTCTSERALWELDFPSTAYEGFAWFSTVALTAQWKSMADEEERNQACCLCDVDDLWPTNPVFTVTMISRLAWFREQLDRVWHHLFSTRLLDCCCCQLSGCWLILPACLYRTWLHIIILCRGELLVQANAQT